MTAQEKDFVRNFLGMQRQMERFLSEAFRQGQPPSFGAGITWTPAVDVYETRTHYVVKAELAGLERDTLSVTFDRGQLVIEGLRRDACSDDRVTCHQMEITYGHFKRTLFISRHVDVEHISAHYEAGFLTVCLPRSDADVPGRMQVTVE